ncbi:MAG: hypothetical protein LH645_02680 [Actinomycetia bacterium]|nr:hypothetical protein [Actinomycetes bacterium]
MTPRDQLHAEQRERVLIDRQLTGAGCRVCDQGQLDSVHHTDTAVREVRMKPGHGQVDYLLYVDRKIAGVIEAKPQGIYRLGQTTGADCSKVTDFSTCFIVDGTEVCRLVRMDDDEAGPGDSGGPWYYGEAAYGYHQGSVGSGCGFLGLSSCDVWSRASYIDEALDVSVRAN